MRKGLGKKTVNKTKYVSQADYVLDYLLGKGRRGATNFEMMINLSMCDVRKRVTEINRDKECKFWVGSVWETSDTMKHYKRYYAISKKQTLEDFLNERKPVKKAGRKSANSRRR